jgi:exonuclease SbcC
VSWKRALSGWRKSALACSPEPLSALRFQRTPGRRQYRALEPGVNQARRDSLEREVKQLAEEGALLRGQLEALLKQQVKEKEELDSLLQQEQALTSQWQTTVSGLHSTCSRRMIFPAGWRPAESEQQLYQHQQRLAWQAQQQAGEQQLRQLQQEQEQRRAQLEAELSPFALSVPQADRTAEWLAQREAESRLWQEQQNQSVALQEQLQQLTPLLDTLPDRAGALPQRTR